MRLLRRIHHCCIALFAFLWFATNCKKSESSQDLNKKCLAEYKGYKLYMSDISDMLRNQNSEQDSIQILNTVSDRWAKDKIFLEKAKAEMSNQQEIESLVQNYREELMLMEFEKKIVKEKLDTTINEEELLAYYQENKSDYKLDNTILRCVFVKINKPFQQKSQFEMWWKSLKSQDIQQLNKYCQNNAEVCFLNQEKWIEWKDLSKFLPSKFISEDALQQGLSREFADFNHHFALKVFEVVTPNQAPPLSYVKNQAVQSILHLRKNKLLDNIRKEYFEKELKEKKVQFYLN